MSAQLIIQVILALLGFYLLMGIPFAVLFVLRGAKRIDPEADTTPIWFKLVILPASAALWPVLLKKWLIARKGTES